MKKYLLILVLLLSGACFGQKTFKDVSGKSFDIMEFRRGYSIDSCIIVEKSNTGWIRPSSDQFKEINNQWFGVNNSHIWAPDPKKDYYPNSNSKWPAGVIFKGSKKYMQDIPGSTFLTSSLIGDNIFYKAVMISSQIEFSGAQEENMGFKCLYSLLLIRPKD
jgi:hypothetical protein